MTDIPASVPANVRAALESEGVMRVPGGGSGFASRHESDAEAALFDFEGKAAAKEAPAKGKETAPPTEEVDERRVESEAPDTEVEGDAEKPKAPPEEEKAEEPEEIALADDLDGLAEQLGMKPDELAEHVKVKVGDSQIPLAEILKGYSPEAKAKETELAEHRQKFDEAVSQARTTWQQKIAEGDRFLAMAKANIAQKPDKAYWDNLLASDPGEYLRQERQWKEYEASVETALHERLKIQDREQGDLKKQKEKMLGEQYALLVKALPDLNDEAKWKTWTGDIRAYAKSVGISDDLLADVHHHQAWVMMDKARKWDALQKGKAEVTKKLAKLPPVTLKPGVKSRPMDDATRNLLDARKRLARSGGKDEEAGAALFERMFQRKR